MVQPDGFGCEILYEAGPCLVVTKPGGLLTQAPPHIDSLEQRVKQFLKHRDHKPGNIYLAMIHRLDRPVSGAVVCARHVRAARRLSEQFEQREVQKIYWARVSGRVEPTHGTWRDFLRKIPDQPQAEIVSADDPTAREAILRYRVLDEHEDETLLEVQLETGRMHQIRVQAAARGLPIVGDAQYGSQRPFGPRTDDPRARWIALHQRQIVFRHPMTGDVVDVQVPLPSYWT